MLKFVLLYCSTRDCNVVLFDILLNETSPKNNSYSSFMEKNKKQLTIEQKGNKRMLKYIKPPLPKIEVE